MKIGFHTDAFNSAYFSFEKCLQWAQKNDVHYIECGLIDGVSWIHGLGYQPHVALYEDPVLLRRKMDSYGVQFSQVDAAYPLSGKDGPIRGVPYVMKSIQWAHLIGCPNVDTTDGMHQPEGLTDAEAMELMTRSYGQIMEVAEAHGIIVNIEPHGYFTTKPDMMGRMLDFVNSKYLRMNMDTGNTFIAGQDPRGVSQAIHRPRQPRARQGRLAVARGRRPRPADRHRRQPMRHRRRRQRRQHPPVPPNAARPRLQGHAEHGMRRPGRSHDREIPDLAPPNPRRPENPG
jgi:sugar phosphate isomerase/epimerase